VVFTLHDYWLFCHLGQLLKPELTICQGPQVSECAKCAAPQLASSKGLRTVFHSLQKVIPKFEKRMGFRKMLSRGYRQYAKIKIGHHEQAQAAMQARANEIKRMCSLVDMFIAPSRFLLEKFVELGIPKQKMTYCDNGFNTLPFKGITKKPSSRIRFGYIGTLIPSKGIHVLLEAFHRIHEKDVELHLHGYYSSFHLGFEDYAETLKTLCPAPNVH